MAKDRPSWFLIPTPNPSECGVSVVVPMNVITNNQAAWPQEGDLLSQNPWVAVMPLALPTRYGNYVYNRSETTTSSEREPAISFIYAMGKTVEEANVPFRETTVKRNHPWPPMLLALALIPDYTFLRQGKGYNPTSNEISEVVAPSYYVREVFVPGVNEGTKMVKREYFGPRPFEIPQTPVPVPTAVSYDINGVRGSFPECLHPDILIQSARSGIAQVVAGVVSEVGGALEGQLFPATNFKEWAPYIASDTQDQDGPGWYRVQWVAIPPPLPKVIVQ